MGNISDGNNILIDSKNNIVLNDDEKLIALYGVENFVVVNTDSTILIIPKDKTSEIKKLISQVKIEKKEYL